MENYDVIVIGGGQSGLATGYYLRRTGLSYIIIDNQTTPGGAWLHTWESLRLFSPAQWSSLPGVLMPGGGDHYPTRDEVVNYLKYYEEKYRLPVRRPEQVYNIAKVGDNYQLHTSRSTYQSKVIVSATGTFGNPYIPVIKGQDIFKKLTLHSSQYESPEKFAGKKIAIIGEGNSGAQILAELSNVSDTIWITSKEPRFLPDDIDGRYLFDAATRMYEAQKTGKAYVAPSLGDIVMVESVKQARDRKVMNSVRPFDHFTDDSLVWANGREEKVDALIYCTGFKPALNYLSGLNVINAQHKVDTIETRSTSLKGFWLVGFGNWTGFASATLIGVGRSAKKTVEEIQEYIGDGNL